MEDFDNEDGSGRNEKVDHRLNAVYAGPNTHIKGKSGKAWFSKADGKWAFEYGDNKYLVNEGNLRIR